MASADFLLVLQTILCASVKITLHSGHSQEDYRRNCDAQGTPLVSVLLKDLPVASITEIDILLRLCRFDHILQTGRKFLAQVRDAENTPLLSVLLEGLPGAGKTALAASLAAEAGYPYTKIISAEALVNLSETNKCYKITKVGPELVCFVWLARQLC